MARGQGLAQDVKVRFLEKQITAHVRRSLSLCVVVRVIYTATEMMSLLGVLNRLVTSCRQKYGADGPAGFNICSY